MTYRLFKHKGSRAAILVAATVALYLNTLYNGFVYDDLHLVIVNPWIRDFTHLREIFSSSIGSFLPDVVSGTYRPMVHVAYIFEYALFGLNPWGWHLVNLLLECAVVLMLYSVTTVLFGRDNRSSLYAFGAVLYFVIHPIHSEVVSWVSTLAELSFTLLILAALRLYISERRPLVFVAVSALLFFVALLFKETALVLLPIVLMYDVAFRDGFSLKLARNWLAYLLLWSVVVAYFILRTYAVQMVAPGRKWFDLSAWQYIMNIFAMVPFYFYKLIIPVKLTAYYYIEPVRAFSEPRAFLSAAFIVILVYAIYKLYRFDRLAFFALSWLGISILPTLYLPGIGKSFFADRYLFFPSAGYVIFVFAMARRLAPVRSRARWSYGMYLIITVITLASILLAAQSIRRNAVWRNGFTLWSDAVRKSPGADLPHYNLAMAYSRRSETAMAIEELRTAIEVNPSYEDAHYNLAVLYERGGLYTESIEMYRKTIGLNPGAVDAHLNLGKLYMQQGQNAMAADELARALALDPALVDAARHLRRLKGLR